jgi:serine/threonine-protein kinase
MVASPSDRTIPLPIDACIGLTGRIVKGQYRIRSLIAQGGMGAIYEAEHVTTGERYAIKALLEDAANQLEITRRFEREAFAMKRLAHPNIVELLDVGAVEDGSLYVVMELVRGPTVRALLDGGALPARRALVIARQVLDALAHAHAQDIVHRDLKPENIMLATVGEGERAYERAKLLDFGLVKLLGDTDDRLTRTGVVSGTPAYMAPEQALGRPIDGRADLYALGVILFEMLTGWQPFRSPDPTTLMRMQASAPVPTLASVAPGRPFCTTQMELLVGGALAKQPDRRWASAADMTAALDEAFRSIDHI